MKNILKKPLFTFILGAVMFSGITGVIAVTMLAKDVSYVPQDTTWSVDNVESALDDLYTKTKDYKKLDTTTTATSNKILN